MDTSLSILLPVFNSEQRLETAVEELLDIAPELTHDFDVLIVDDGSTDDTSDAARDLARRFPQVRVARHAMRLGLARSIQTGLDHSNGEMVLVADVGKPLRPTGLRNLWQVGGPSDRMGAGHTTAFSTQSTWLERLLGWSKGNPPTTEGDHGQMHLVRREAFAELRLSDQHSREGNSCRLDGGSSRIIGAIGRPKYLDKIKRFAWGE